MARFRRGNVSPWSISFWLWRHGYVSLALTKPVIPNTPLKKGTTDHCSTGFVRKCSNKGKKQGKVDSIKWQCRFYTVHGPRGLVALFLFIRWYFRIQSTIFPFFTMCTCRFKANEKRVHLEIYHAGGGVLFFRRDSTRYWMSTKSL